MGERELKLVCGLLVMTGWLLVLSYGVAWFARYRGEPKLDTKRRMRWLSAAAMMFVAGALVAVLAEGGFPKIAIAWLAAAGLCGINAAELAGLIQTKKR